VEIQLKRARFYGPTPLISNPVAQRFGGISSQFLQILQKNNLSSECACLRYCFKL